MAGEQEGHPFSFHHAELAGRDPGEIVLLDEAESRHLRSLRLDEGETVVLTDGRGHMRTARLGEVRGRRREALLGSSRQAPAARAMELAVSVGNRTRMLWLIEKATEFGVPVIALVETERSRSVADAGRSDGFRAKAERRALAAMKQSGGARLPEIRAPAELAEYLSEFAARGIGTGVLLDPMGEPLARHLDEARDPITALVGPEGGLTEAEIRRCAAAGFLAARLGPTLLRFETAALAAVSVVAQRATSKAARREE
ncbi:MAG: RsmE family RNA methyltransferase [Gemmatimonadota bacterium]